MSEMEWWEKAKSTLGTMKGKVAAVVVAIGVVGAAFAKYDDLNSIITDTDPKIEFAGDDTQLFVLPIKVSNPSHFFSMTDMKFTCNVPQFLGTDGSSGSIGRMVIGDEPPVTIAPKGDYSEYRCRLAVNKNLRVSKATFQPELDYRILGVQKHFKGRKFTWYGNANPPRWIGSDTP